MPSYAPMVWTMVTGNSTEKGVMDGLYRSDGKHGRDTGYNGRGSTAIEFYLCVLFLNLNQPPQLNGSYIQPAQFLCLLRASFGPQS